jgi:hypothetical protein
MSNRSISALIISVFFISFCIISYEITLMRLLSSILDYHYVSAIVCLALLGSGTGSIYMHFFAKKDKGYKIFLRWLSVLSLSIVIASLSICIISNNDLLRNNLLVYLIPAFLPFFCCGVILAFVYSLIPHVTSYIYSADMIGVAIGCVAVIFLINCFGTQNALLLYSIIIAILGLYLSKIMIKKCITNILIFLLTIVLFILGLSPSSAITEVSISTNPDKEIYDAINLFDGKIKETTYGAFGRIDLIQYPDHIGWMDIYLNGTAGMPMYKYSGVISDPNINHLKKSFTGYFPFHTLSPEQKKNALIIGPGGGRDILVAKLGGVENITAVEVNKDIVKLVKRYSNYNGNIYDDYEGVQIIVDEGRSFVKRQKSTYDIIMLSLAVTNTNRSREGLSLTENYLFTVESIGDYIAHLTEQGSLIVIAHDDVEILRLLTTCLTVFEKCGLESEDAMKHFYILGSDTYPVFVLKKVPLTKEESEILYNLAIEEFGFNPMSTYFPLLGKGKLLNSFLVSMETGQLSVDEAVKNVESHGYDISPVTDNNPFFYKFEKGIPKTLSLVLRLSLLILMLVILIPLVIYRKKSTKIRFKKYTVTYILTVLFLGMGFMLVEISLLQKFILFFGEPVMSIAVLLSSILLGAGLGSFFSNRIALEKTWIVIARSLLCLCIVLILYVVFLPGFLQALLNLQLWKRLIVAFAMLLPLGFIMGIPFPLAIRSLKLYEKEAYIPWLLGINCLSSVMGSSLATVISIGLGLNEALIIGVLCYAMLLVFLVLNKVTSTNYSHKTSNF